MSRNSFWTPSLALQRKSLDSWVNPDGYLVLTDTNGDGSVEDNLGGTLGFGIESLDHIPVFLSTSASYVFVAVGDYTPLLSIFDNQGYLLNFVDGDAIGLYDAIGSDSIVNFSPDYSGTYYLSVSWEFVQGSPGVYGLAGGSIGAIATPPPPPPPPPPAGPELPVISGTADGDALDGGDEGESIRGYSGDDTIRGLDGDDIIHGDDGNDDVNGNLGSDKVHGGPGQDFVRGGQGNDAVYGQDGDDWHVNGNIGDDSVYGGLGNDQVFGGPGQDTLYGEAGNDALSGDLGNDRLFGGPGADHFVFHSGAGWDLIQDFKRSDGDKILVQGNINGTGITTPQQLAASVVSDGGGGWIVDLGNGDKIGLLSTASPGADDFWVV